MIWVFFSIQSALAATTGSVTISGSIPSATHVVVTPTTGYNNLDLVNGVANQSVCTVREINNTVNGYTVTLTSSNAGKLKNGTIGEITYTAKYNGVSVVLSTVAQTITSQGSQTSIVNTVKDFIVSVPATSESEAMQGQYSDTLLFTITSN